MNAIQWHRRPRAQMEALQQLQARYAFQDEQDGLLVDGVRCDLRVATFARFKIEFETRDLFPEHSVVEGRKPLLDLLHVNERFHQAIMPNGTVELQITRNS